MKDAVPTAVHLHDYAPPAWALESVNLCFVLDPRATRVRSRLRLRRIESKPVPLVLDGEGMGDQPLELTMLLVDGKPVDADAWHQDARSLTLHAPPPAFELEIETRIDPLANTALSGLYVSGGNFCTQCEAEGFRRISYFLDRPDVLAVYTVRIEADQASYPVLLSNGNPVDAGELPGGRHFAVWHDPFPKPSYLFALVAGDLACHRDRFITMSGREVELRIHVRAHDLDRCDHAMRSLKAAMAWDERVWGREYDLDVFMIVAVDDFNMGAMENKGLNIFNSRYVLARPETATDDDFVNIESIIAHEYFHNWSGNRVTCRDWFQLSLKEGLTVFRDQEFTADQSLAAVKRIQDVQRLRSLQFPEDGGPMAHPVRPTSYLEINNFYTMTVYEKGAELVRMIQTRLGAQAFRRGMDLYFERHDGRAVTIEDFLRAMEDASGHDLGSFRIWYDQAGTPVLEVEGRHDPATRRYHLSLRQHCPPTPGQMEKRPLPIPLRLALLDAHGAELPLRLVTESGASGHERVFDISQAVQELVFEDIGVAPVPSLLRGFSAPVILHYPYRRDELAFLMSHDGDPFNRWEAGQRYAVLVLLDLVNDVQAGRKPSVDAEFIRGFARVLDDPRLDEGLVADALNLPSEVYLGEQMAVIDVDAVHQARQFLRAELGRALGDAFRLAHDRLETSPSDLDARSMARRKLRNQCLSYLCAAGGAEAEALAEQRYLGAGNMTDAIAALRALTESGAGPAAARCLAHFEARWHDDPLVLDKWFSLQAMSPAPGALTRVQALMRHPVFSLSNPNRVRAVLGSFANGNPVHFHARDGSAYRFIADQVLELDAINPQIAARLAGSLSRWKRYDAGRQASMQECLCRIETRPGLSRDVLEIVSRSLYR